MSKKNSIFAADLEKHINQTKIIIKNKQFLCG